VEDVLPKIKDSSRIFVAIYHETNGPSVLHSVINHEV